MSTQMLAYYNTHHEGSISLGSNAWISETREFGAGTRGYESWSATEVVEPTGDYALPAASGFYWLPCRRTNGQVINVLCDGDLPLKAEGE